jgi:hypothetical protein
VHLPLEHSKQGRYTLYMRLCTSCHLPQHPTQQEHITSH